MKLSDVRELFYNRSAKASDIARQLALAGIAVIWIFNVDSKVKHSLPIELYRPLYLFCFCLLLDLIQYIYATIAWALVMHNNKKVHDDHHVNAWKWINVPTWSFFAVKIIILLTAYYFLLLFVIDKV